MKQAKIPHSTGKHITWKKDYGFFSVVGLVHWHFILFFLHLADQVDLFDILEMLISFPRWD